MSDDSSKDSSDNTKRSSRSTASKIAKKNPAPARNFGHPVRIIVTTIAVFFVSQIIAAIIVQLALEITGWRSSDLSQSATLQFLYVLVAEALVVTLVWRVLARRGMKLSSIGLGRLPGGNDITKAAVGFGAFYGLVIAVTFVLTKLFPLIDTDEKQDIGFKNLATLSDQFLAFVALVILPPIGEEILVRGYLYGGLRKAWNFMPAMLVTSALFAVAHLPSGSQTALLWAAAVNTFVLSIVLVYLREKTGAIYAGILVHGLNNLIAFGVYF